MAMYQLEDPGELVAPALIVAFEGWVSAGSAGTATAEHVASKGEVIATFDPDELFDFRANRPVVDFLEGVITKVTWPQISLRHIHIGRDLLVLSGTEPNWHWQRFADEVASLAVRLGVVEHVSLGGVPWAIPHTRPTSIVETASTRENLSPGANHPEGLLRVPGAAVSIVEQSVMDRGIPTYGFWARVPHYVGATYTPAVVALTERIGTHLGISIPLGSLVDDAADQRRLLDDLIEEQPQAKAVVERLEAMVDEEDSVSGEELAAEIERFLADRDRGEDPFTGGLAE